MAKQYERTIMCKNCGEAEIGLFEGKWYDTKSDIMHTKTCKNPPSFKRRSTYAKPELVSDAIAEEIRQIKEELNKHDDAIRALVKEVSFKKGSEVE